MRSVGFTLVASLCAASSGLVVMALVYEGAPVPAATAPETAGRGEASVERENPTILAAAPGPTLKATPRRRETQDPGHESGVTPTDSRSGDARPGEAGADAPPPARAVRQLTRWGCLTRVDASGDLSYEFTRWNAACRRDGYDLVAYDLAPLAPTAQDLCEALRGHRQERVAAATDAPWWRGLCEKVVLVVGAERWPVPATLLAWDQASAMLFVRQDAQGQRRVEQYIEQLGRGRLGTIGIVARMDGPPDVAPLALEVPWGSSVRAHQGSTWFYVQDFEVEVAQDAFTADPIVANADTGFAFTARRVEGRDPSGDLEVELAFSEDALVFDRSETTCFSVPVVIEIPRPRRVLWRGLVPAFPATYSIPFDDGRLVTLTVLGEDGGVTLARGLARRALGDAADAENPVCSKECLRLTCDVPAEEFTCDIALVPKDREGRSSRLEGSAVVEGRAGEGAPGTGIAGLISFVAWPQPSGGVSIRASTIEVDDLVIVDLVLDRAWPADEIRFPGGAPIDTSHPAAKWPMLTVSRMHTQSVRAVLRRGSEGRVAVTGASGQAGDLRLARFAVARNP